MNKPEEKLLLIRSAMFGAHELLSKRTYDELGIIRADQLKKALSMLDEIISETKNSSE